MSNPIFETVKKRWSIPLGKIAGVPILTHLTFWLMVAWIGSGIGFLLLLLGVCSVLAHEFGHVLVAKRLDVETKEVMLLPIGAAAEMPNMPQGTRTELAIALAGPMVSMLLAVIFMGLSFVLPAPEVAVEFPYWSTPQEVCFYLGVFNGAIGLFNLVPAFPTDGGRVLRSLLAMKLHILTATKITATIALVFSAIGGGLAIFTGNPVLFLIAVFVFLASQGEYHHLKKQQEAKFKQEVVESFEKMLEDPEFPHREEAEFILQVLKGVPEEETVSGPTISVGKWLTVFALSAVFWAYVSDIVFMGVLAVGGAQWVAVVASVAFIVLALYVTMKVAKPLWRETRSF